MNVVTVGESFLEEGERKKGGECFKWKGSTFGKLESLCTGSFDGHLLLRVLLQLLAKVLPILNHQLLNTEQGLVPHIGIIVAEKLHHQLLST